MGIFIQPILHSLHPGVSEANLQLLRNHASKVSIKPALIPTRDSRTLCCGMSGLVLPSRSRAANHARCSADHANCPWYALFNHLSLMYGSLQTTYIVRALYDHKRWVTVCMFVVFSVQIVSAIAVAVTLLPYVRLNSTCFPTDDDIRGKIYDAVTMFVTPFFSRLQQHLLTYKNGSISVPPLVLELIMFVLTVGQAQYTARTQGWTSQTIPLLRLMVRDGSWACLLVFGMSQRAQYTNDNYIHSPVAVIVVNVILQSTQRGPVAWAGLECVPSALSIHSVCV